MVEADAWNWKVFGAIDIFEELVFSLCFYFGGVIYIDCVDIYKSLIFSLVLDMRTNKFPKDLHCNFNLRNLNGYRLELFYFFWIGVAVKEATWYVRLLKSPFLRRWRGIRNLGLFYLLQGHLFWIRVAVIEAVWYDRLLRITLLRLWLGTCNLGFLFKL